MAYKNNHNGYIFVYVRGRGKVGQHRLIIEEKIGRRLRPDEHVHHINGVRDDNRIENLQLLSNSEHATLTFSKKYRHCKTCTCHKGP
jgi:hypothetical protein